MAKLVWDEIGAREFQAGVDKGVLFPMNAAGAYQNGVAWSGLTSVKEKPTGAEAKKMYANNKLYATVYSNEEFEGSIEAYTYPDEFAPCIGEASIGATSKARLTAQSRLPFGFAYRIMLGNDTAGLDAGYEIHLVYGCQAKPSERDHATVNESIEAATLSWDFTTTPVEIEGFKPTAHVVIPSTDPKISAVEAKIYGSASSEAELPTLAELKTLLISA